MTFDPQNPLARLEDETANSYRALLDYAHMGAKRSLQALFDLYSSRGADNSQIEKPPTTRFPTIKGWCFRYDWVNRVKAWDAVELERRTEEYAGLRNQLIEDELRDYNTQLEKWTAVLERTKIHETASTKTVKDDNGQERTIQVVELNVSDWERLTRWRAEISKQGRLALGLPDKITEAAFNGGRDQQTGKPRGIKIIEVVVSEDED